MDSVASNSRECQACGHGVFTVEAVSPTLQLHVCRQCFSAHRFPQPRAAALPFDPPTPRAPNFAAYGTSVGVRSK